MMKILIACEESQIVQEAFIKRGHSATSCDMFYNGAKGLPHYKGDVRDLLNEFFDLVIFHPPCTYLANSGVRWLYSDTSRWIEVKKAGKFFNLRHKFNAKRICTENPIPHFWGRVYTDEPNQIIQPWQFGHKQMKATCLWLKNLPPLEYTDIVGPPPLDKKERYKWQDVWTASPGPERQKMRSRTFEGIAEAMADQWGTLKK